MTLCRCCNCNVDLSLCKDLFSKNVSFGKEEVYSLMIQECFGIRLGPSKNNNICHYCIMNLRNAINFREQLLLSEKALSLALNDEDKTQVKVKNEVFLSMDGDNFFDDTLFKMELEEKNKVHSEDVLVKVERQRSASPFTDEESDFQNTVLCPVVKLTEIKNKFIKINKKTDNRHINKKKHQHNLYTILNCSNVVPFKNKTIYGYVCNYCNEPYPDPADLRQHTEEKHRSDRLNMLKTFKESSLIIRLDVTNLECTICNEGMQNLKKLKEHLVSSHGKKFYKLKDHILEFKLQAGEKYDCALCVSTHETFKMLKQHMNIHYSNYECKLCGTPFVTSNGLFAHEKTHQEGNFKCGYCDKVFISLIKKNSHEKTHKGIQRVVTKCPHCDVSFKNYYQRNQHMFKEHNTELPYKCNVCNKGFLLKGILMNHVKRSHLMERNYQCSECPVSFFSGKDLKHHMIKHTGEKLYQCEVCHKSYGRKRTLREHMRIHNNDRRYKCEVCPMAFVQKCSLKSHLLSNHKISLNSG